jgi:hypothetical protein
MIHHPRRSVAGAAVRARGRDSTGPRISSTPPNNQPRIAQEPSSVSARTVGRAYALARIGTGAVLTIAPRLGGRLLGDIPAFVTVRLLGVRDVLLGVDALIAPAASPSWRRAMVLCALADTADAVTGANRLHRREPFAFLVTMAAGAGAATGMWIARSASDDPTEAAQLPAAHLKWAALRRARRSHSA